MGPMPPALLPAPATHRTPHTLPALVTRGIARSPGKSSADVSPATSGWLPLPRAGWLCGTHALGAVAVAAGLLLVAALLLLQTEGNVVAPRHEVDEAWAHHDALHGGHAPAESAEQPDADAADIDVAPGPRYLMHLPSGAVGAQLLDLKTACLLARASNRTLVLPMAEVQPPAALAKTASSAWMPLDLYLHAAALRRLPCQTLSMAALWQWLRKHPLAESLAADHGGGQGVVHASGTTTLRYLLTPGAATMPEDMRKYYHGVIELPFSSPGRWTGPGTASAAARAGAAGPSTTAALAEALRAVRDTTIVALGALGAVSAAIDDGAWRTSTLQDAVVHAYARKDRPAAATPPAPPPGPAPPMNVNARVVRHLLISSRLHELAHSLRRALFTGPFVALDVAQAPGAVACQQYKTHAERTLCQMPPELYAAAFYDLRVALAEEPDLARAADSAEGNQAAAAEALPGEVRDVNNGAASADRAPPAAAGAAPVVANQTATKAASTRGTPPPVMPAAVPVDVLLWNPDPATESLQLWQPIVHSGANDAVVAPWSKLWQLLDTKEHRPLLKELVALNNIEIALVGAQLCMDATWYIGNPYSPLSRLIAERRQLEGRFSYFLSPDSPYVLLVDGEQ